MNHPIRYLLICSSLLLVCAFLIFHFGPDWEISNWLKHHQGEFEHEMPPLLGMKSWFLACSILGISALTLISAAGIWMVSKFRKKA